MFVSLSFSGRKALVLLSYCLSSTASPFQFFSCFCVGYNDAQNILSVPQWGGCQSHREVFTCSSTDFLEPLCFSLKTTRTANTSQPKELPGPFFWLRLRENVKSISRNTSLHIFQHPVICSSGTCWSSADASVCNCPRWIFQLRNVHYLHGPSFSPYCLFPTGEHNIVQNLPQSVACAQRIKPALLPSLRLIKLQLFTTS